MKYFYLFVGLAATLLASCSTQEEDFHGVTQNDVVYLASIEQPAGDETKVFANEDLYLRWNADDRVSIFNKITFNQQYKFTGNTGDNSGTFKRIDSDEFVTGNDIAHVVSVYPYQKSTTISENETLSVVLPAQQRYTENTFGLGANTMVAISEDNFLHFKNVGGYLKISLYGEGITVSALTLKGNKGEKLAGNATITMPLGGIPSLVMEDEATDMITLVCESPVQLGATADKSTDFWIVVPPMTFKEGFSIGIKQGNSVLTKSTSKEITLTRSHVSKMSPLKVEAIPEGSYVDEYGVNYGQGITLDGVIWAPVNCGYKPETPDSKGYPYGKLYQWGRKYGQGYGKPYYSSSDTYEDETTPIIEPTWGGKNEDADKDTFYYGSRTDNYNWIYSSENFWNSGTVDSPKKNEMYDPCPEGWRVPTEAELSALFGGNSSELTTKDGVYGVWASGSQEYNDNLADRIFMPAGGGRFADNWAHNNGANGRGSGWSYWSSGQRNNGGVDAGEWGKGDLSNQATYKAFGFTVRCCKDEVATIIIPVAEISLDQTSISLEPGQSTVLTALIKPANATDKTVTWTSSNSNVATVNDGKVTAIAEGSATITATAGGKSATCFVTVKIKTIEVSSVSLDKTEITLIEGDSQKLTATVKPDNATDKTVTWTSSNNNVATVDDGTVRAIAEGSATITATAGEKSAICTVVVTKQVIDVTSVSLDKTEITMNMGESRTLAATVKPDNATDKTVTWTSSNTNVAKVEGGKVTALSEGGAIISASAGNMTATCTVTVLGSDPVIKAVYSGIDLSSGGSCTPEGSLWKLSENTRLTVTLKNNSFDTITITGLSLICSRTNTSYPFSIDNQDLKGGEQFTTTVSLTETLYSPILEFTYQSDGNTLTARTTFTGTFDNSTTEPYPFDPFDPGFN